MQIDRDIYRYLREFFKKERKALLVSGARQIGKTYAVRHIGREMFEHFIELNFIEQPHLKDVFSNPRNTKDILLRLSVLSGETLSPGNTLIFFDEIQECPDIITAIKFLVDDGTYRYVLSGSLLGVQIKDIRSIPVGYMTEYKMYPISICEFATAMGMSATAMEHIHECYLSHEPVDMVIHAKMLELIRLYLIVGGMPEAVARFLETNNIREVQAVQRDILNMYRMDIAKYDLDNKLYIQEIFDLIPSELNAPNKRFILKSLNLNARFDRYKNSFLWLADAGVALPTYNVTEPRLPLRLNETRNLFKLFQNDVGLLCSCNTAEVVMKIITGEGNINYGAIYENLVAQELTANGYGLYYFNSKTMGELDFVTEHNGDIMPIEVKSGKDYKRHNALSTVISTANYDIPQALVLSNSNVKEEGKILYLPIYMIMHLKPEMLSQPIVTFTPV